MIVAVIRHACAVIAAGCLMTGSALATPITYSFSGTASGTLGTTTFTNASFTATASGDTAAIVTLNVNTFCNDLGPVIITIGGIGSVTTIAPNLVFSNQGNAIWGFENGVCVSPSADWLDVDDAAAATYALNTAVGPLTGTQDFGSAVATSGGTLTLTTVPLTFQASSSPVVAVAVPMLGRYVLTLLAALLCASGWFMFRRRGAAHRR